MESWKVLVVVEKPVSTHLNIDLENNMPWIFSLSLSLFPLVVGAVAAAAALLLQPRYHRLPPPLHVSLLSHYLLHSVVMATEVELRSSLNAPLQRVELSDMAVSRRILLKKEPKSELAKVRSIMENLGYDNERMSADRFCSTIREACFSTQNKDSTGRKRKTNEICKSNNSEVVSVVACASSDFTSEILNSQIGKRIKMDSIKMKECTNVLKTLMNHYDGWMFNQPVDPIILEIPDYFEIISKPMDLGTIKQNLAKKFYSTTNQFAEHVRLTFSNAMCYNPPLNIVHIKAKELDKIFNARWKLLEFKWRKENAVALQHPERKRAEKETILSKESTNLVINLEGLTRKSQRGHGGTSVTSGGISRTLKVLSARKKNGPFVGAEHQNESRHASSNGVNSEKLLGRKNFANHSIVSKQDNEKSSGVKDIVGRTDHGIVPEAAIAADGDNIQHDFDPSCLVAATSHTGTDLPCDQLPPTKALRAARLKTRFVDTIFKAQQKTLLNNGEIGDPAKLKREREKLEKRQQEENARIVAQLRAADEAKMKALADRKMQREKLREVARFAVEKVGRTVDIDDNSLNFNKLENFVFSKVMRHNLAELGLFLKEDAMDEEDESWISAIDYNLEDESWTPAFENNLEDESTTPAIDDYLEEGEIPS